MKHRVAHNPRKRFGQNFLTDPFVIQKIIDLINPKPEDQLVEIGPGLGALTFPLLNYVEHLDIIEIDRDLASKFENNLAVKNKLSIHLADALKFDFNTLFKNKKLKVLGNLPYNISTPLIFHLLKFAPIIEDMHFMLQKEVVDRLTAVPNHKDYGRLSIMAQYSYKTANLLPVPPSAFVPEPKVQSCIVRLIPHPAPPYPVNNLPLFREIVTHAFTLRRKTINNALKRYLKLEDFKTLNMDSNARPETLSISDYVKICNHIEKIKHGEA